MPTLKQLSLAFKIDYVVLIQKAESEDWESAKSDYWAKAFGTFLTKRGNGRGSVKAIRDAMVNVCSQNVSFFQIAMAALIEKASKGNMEAIKFLFPYILGLPAQDVNITLEDERRIGMQLDIARLSDKELQDSLKLITRLKTKCAPASDNVIEGQIENPHAVEKAHAAPIESDA
jgi:hypothetical protein